MDRIFSCSISYACVFVVMHYINGALIGTISAPAGYWPVW